jgi:glutamate synthase (NADPH/NADH) small chain
MGEVGGFLTQPAQASARRPVEVRLRDYREVTLPMPAQVVAAQGGRCMDCGVPFCHHGCPLGNLIPEWNDLVYRDDWRGASERLQLTNNFPEFTGRLCPAPCEPSCVLAINDAPVTIKQIEASIADRGFSEGWVRAEPPSSRTGLRVAVVGSGPAGLAAAQELNRRGHWVTVFERADRLGGLLRYGIPDFKLEKWVLDRRLDLLSAEGVSFETGRDVGTGTSLGTLRASFDAVVIATGAGVARELDVPGRELGGVHLAMAYLEQQNRRVAGAQFPADLEITARGKHVVILGGGDTGADCLGNVLREECISVRQFELLTEPPASRADSNPWPQWPLILRTSVAHEEGGVREFGVLTTHLRGSHGVVTNLHGVRVDYDSESDRGTVATKREFSVRADLILLAMGFTHPEHTGLLDQLGAAYDVRGNLAVDEHFQTSVEGVFAAGDVHRGASLIVWAIAEGRRAAHACDVYLATGERGRDDGHAMAGADDARSERR